MSDEAKKPVSGIRTFAQDLDMERAKRKADPARSDDHQKEEPAEAMPVAETPKAAPVVIEREHPKEKAVTMPKITAPAATPHKPEAPAKIPAFHELHKQKKVRPNDLQAAIDKDLPVPPKHPDKSPKVTILEPDDSVKLAPKTIYGGTVITDTKQSDFKLFPSIVASIKKWFESISLRNKKRNVPKYTVPETNRRKGVIQKATAKTGTIFTADNETLKEKIRQRRLQELEAGKEIEASWSPYTETGFNLLDAPPAKPDVTKNVVVEFKKQTRLEMAPAAPAAPVVPEKPVVEQSTAVAEKAPEPVVVVPPEVDQPVEPVTTSQPEAVEETVADETQEEAVEEATPEELPADEQTEIIEDDLEDDTELTDEQFAEPEPISFLQAVRQFDTNALTILLLLSIVGLAAVIFILVSVFTKSSDSPEATTFEIPQQELVLNANRVALKVTKENTSHAIAESLKNLPAGLTEASLVNAGDMELSPAATFKLLKFHTEPSFSQSVVVARFLNDDELAPALILRFTDADTVRGGLLQWEPTMADDLADLMAIQTKTVSRFKDAVVADHDVRILSTDTEPLLVYGLVDNTVIITTSEESFERIAQLGFTK